MTEDQLQKLFMLLRRPIPWDPVPWWIKLDEEKLAQFNEVQARLNARIADLEAQKVKALSKIVGIKI